MLDTENKNENQNVDENVKQEAFDSVLNLEKESSNLKDIKIHTMPDKFLKNLLKMKIKKSGKGTISGGKRKIFNKNLAIGVSVGFVFVIILALAAWLFIRSINQSPDEDLSLQTLEDNSSIKSIPEVDLLGVSENTCSVDNCDKCDEEQCLMFQDSCHLEVSYEICEYNINEECVAQKCIQGPSQIYTQEEDDYYNEEPVTKDVNEFVLAKDSDYDGLSDIEEEVWGTDPNNLDTDNDSYVDGKELVSLYSPLSQGKILKEEDVAKYFVDEMYGYGFIYPNIFNLIKMDEQGGNLIIQSSTTQEFFNILILDNETGFNDVVEWYLSDKPNLTLNIIQDNNQMTKLGDYDAVRTEDGLNIFALVGRKIFLVSYSPGVSNELNFVATFNMMLKSFEFFNNPF